MRFNMHWKVSIFEVNVMVNQWASAPVKGLRQRLIKLLKSRAGVSMGSEHADVHFCQSGSLEMKV